jgi:uncharacterized membrane protein YgdD (TMEM256/DUF423 family)
MRKTFLRLGAALLIIAVILGAFGAHGLEGKITAERLDTFETGVRYHFYHAFAILILGVLLYFRKTPLMITAGYLFLAGILLFSGSIYLIAVSDIFDLPLELIGPITPVGGSLFILGWIIFLVSTYQTNQLYKRREE